MKKRIAYILLGSFLINSVIYFFLFPFIINSFKERFNEEERELKRNGLKIITVAAADLHKINFIDAKEMIYEGKLYDIFERKYEQDKIVFHCYHDSEEEKALERHNDFEKKQNTRNINNLTIPGFALVAAKADVNILPCQSTGLYKNVPSFYSRIVLEIPDPPPNSI